MVCSASIRAQLAPKIGYCHNSGILPNAQCLHFRHKVLQAGIDRVEFCIDGFASVIVCVEVANLSDKAGSLQGLGLVCEG